MNIDVPLTDKHSQELISFQDGKQRLTQKELGLVFASIKTGKERKQPEVSKFIHGDLEEEPSYIHIIRYIKALKDDKRSKPLRRILAEHIIHEFCAELPRLDMDSFPLKCKINLSNINDISLLKKFIAKSYLEDFDDDIGLSENIVISDIDNQSYDYWEGFMSALIYLLFSIEEILHRDKDSEIVIPNLFWFIELMGPFNMMQWHTAFDKDISTEYDKKMCLQSKLIIDSDILQLSQPLQNVLIQFCPSSQMNGFYRGWHCFCYFISENHINRTDGDILFYYRSNKYFLLDLLSFCLDKFMEKRHDYDHKVYKNMYDFFVSVFKMDGYEGLEKKLVQISEEVYKIKNMENILLCLCNKVKGIRVVIDLIFASESCKDYEKPYTSQLKAYSRFVDLMKSMEKYFGTEEIAARQIKNFKIDISSSDKVYKFIDDLTSARKILYVYRRRNDRNRQGRQDTLTKISQETLPPESFAAIKEFRNREEFYHFLQSSEEIIDYFSNPCEETNAEFLKLFLKVGVEIVEDEWVIIPEAFEFIIENY